MAKDKHGDRHAGNHGDRPRDDHRPAETHPADPIATPAGGTTEPTIGGHHVATAHGEAATVDASLPATREELLALHAETRLRRNAAELGSAEHHAAVDLIGRIEVRIAAVERDQVPPLV